MSVVIFNPSPELFEHYKADDDVIFYNEDGWWISKAEGRVCQGHFTAHKNITTLPPISVLITRIREFGPLWERWISKGDQYELLYRDALFNIVEISQGLEEYCVKTAVFNTGVTHHISTMIFELACVLARVKQVFLYTNNIMLGRLLPLIQDESIKDRRPISLNLSKEKAEENIHRFYNNRQSGGTPESGGELPKRHEESVFIALLSIAKSLLKNTFRPLKWFLLKKTASKNVFNKFYHYSASTHFKQVIQQHSALSFYRQKIKNQDVPAFKSSQECRLLIAAHFQPEATSFPEGWDCHNNIDIALELRRKGYSKELLYKEHPATSMYTAEGVDFTRVGMYRSKRYFEQLIQLGCVFIDPSTDLPLTSENHWYLPVTITGTIAIERSLAGLHTVVTGHPWYKGLPGTLQLSDVESFAEIKKEWVEPNPKLAKLAFEFLDNVLSEKTMINTLGFGIGKPLSNAKDRSVFLEEFDKLLSGLKRI